MTSPRGYGRNRARCKVLGIGHERGAQTLGGLPDFGPRRRRRRDQRLGARAVALQLQHQLRLTGRWGPGGLPVTAAAQHREKLVERRRGHATSLGRRLPAALLPTLGAEQLAPFAPGVLRRVDAQRPFFGPGSAQLELELGPSAALTPLEPGGLF